MVRQEKKDIEDKLKLHLVGFDIHQEIYKRAYKFLYDEFREDKGLYESILVWANQYISKNNLGEYVGSASNFLMEYVMTGEYSDIPRYAALKEIIRDKGLLRR